MMIYVSYANCNEYHIAGKFGGGRDLANLLFSSI